MLPSILSLQLVEGIKDFLSTTFESSTPEFFDFIKKFADKNETVFKGLYYSLALPFKKGLENKNFYPAFLGDDFKPYYHQELAFKRLNGDKKENTLIATGTGSGKTEAFMFPILDYCYQNKNQKGIKAIIIYPVNALATDQAKRFAKTISSNQNLKDIRVGLFIGAKDENQNKRMTTEYVITDRDILCETPPDILLTNYKMLDFMLMRPKEQKIWFQNINKNILKFISVDEIHTFDGAQGTDLGLLLRRLKSKLKIQKDSICCIGTSATLGSESTSSIREFAENVFDENFSEDSVITEYRLNYHEFFKDIEVDFEFYPEDSQIDKMYFKNYINVSDFIREQYFLWFGRKNINVDSDEFKVELGNELKKHKYFRFLIKFLDGKIQSETSIVDFFKNIIPQQASDLYFKLTIASLVALVSWARNQKLGKSYPPFLFVRVQLWLRELSRMVASFEKTPELNFFDDLKKDEPKKYYPVIHCRDCLATGWGAVKKVGDNEYLNDLQTFYQEFFSYDQRVQFIFPVEDENVFKISSKGNIHYINLSGFEVEKESSEEKIKVFISNEVSSDSKKYNNCPFCNGIKSLTIVGSRAASLTSVLIGQLFSSYFNDDKKLITFSDSVQDSAHRAGFFGARSYQFTVRSAFLQVLKNYNKDISISDFSDYVQNFWQKKFNNDIEYISTFIAPDMEWLKEYETVLKYPDNSNQVQYIKDLVNNRLDWMVFSEFTYKANIGRTLERCESAVLYIDKWESSVSEIFETLRNEYEELRNYNISDFEKFIFGFLNYLKEKGAVNSKHLKTYIENAGNPIILNKINYLPDFHTTAGNPRFISEGNFQNFLKISNNQHNTWFDIWIEKNFTKNSPLISFNYEHFYKTVIKELKNAQIIKEHYIQGNAVWALNTDNLIISQDVLIIKCNKCQHKLYINIKDKNYAENLPCTRKGCSGYYTNYDTTGELNYYKHLYSYGDLKRIVSREHTGLLKRSEREKIENEFINRKENEPWKTNLLSATPTLEMGIDIGDLSSVILCSVPPGSANYLQRIGRAGRLDGNSLNVTLANSETHDLYFYAMPEEIMAGFINAPGVFIEACAILKRQFFAFCIDNWVIDKNIQIEELPDKLSKSIQNIKAKNFKGFPYTLLTFIKDKKDDLLKAFFELFGYKLNQSAKEFLEIFAMGDDNDNSLEYDVLQRIEFMQKQQDSIKTEIKKLRKNIRDLEEKEAKPEDYKEILNLMNAEIKGYKHILKTMRDKRTLEFFIDEGLLPNYAFPESGVTLQSVIYRKRAKDDKSGFETYSFEYERPGARAITEFAPESSFYAGGRKVEIDQIDMKVSDLEKYRFCDKCSYCAINNSELPEKCPVCNSELFNDSGQVKDVVRMKQVIATTQDKKSRLNDSSDSRTNVFYDKELLINFDKKNILSAYAIKKEEALFGFEFISKVDFKEFNFGQKTLNGEDVRIAGKVKPRKGFIICKSCGKVQKNKRLIREGFSKHSFNCDINNKEDETNYLDSLYLYREFKSEAIRIMLPVTDMDIDYEKLKSLTAAIHTGLREYFRGSVEHLNITLYDEVLENTDYSKRYLILYDTVPGGTGYLQQLTVDKEQFFLVINKAINKLENCQCTDDISKDGCYRCVYAYKNKYERPSISRKQALEVLKKIYKQKSNIEKVQTISDINTNSLTESVLEELFLARIKSIACNFKKEITSTGKAGYIVEFDQDITYELCLQVELNKGEQTYSIADFVFYPLKNSNLKPIVIFTDGFSYHENRLDKDTAQRNAILSTNQYIVWSLTWEDVEKYKNGSNNNSIYKFTNFLIGEHIKNISPYFDKINQVADLTSMELLIKLLRQNLNIDIFNEIAQATGICFLKNYVTKENIFKIILPDKTIERLKIHDKEKVYGIYEDENIKIISCFLKEDLIAQKLNNNIFVIYLKNKINVDISNWAGALRLYNIMQFNKKTVFVTETGLENNVYKDIALFRDEKQKYNKEWEAVFENVLDEVKNFVRELYENNIPVPEVGIELVDYENSVIGEAELYWKDLKIALTLDKEIKSEKENIFNLEQTEQLLETLIKLTTK